MFAFSINTAHSVPVKALSNSQSALLKAVISVALTTLPATAQLVSLQVASAYREVVGTAGAAVPGSGTLGNYPSTYDPNAFAVFRMDQTLSGPGFSTIDMRVSVNPSTSGVTRLMIARTVNSQGLTDVGTVSVLFIGGPDATATNHQYNLSLNFEFGAWNVGTQVWTPMSLTNRLSVTTFDLDYTQYVRVNASDFGSMTRSGDTRLIVTPNVTTPNGAIPVPAGTFQVGDAPIGPLPGSDSTVSDLRNAVSFNSIGTLDFNMSFGKSRESGPSLHMFDFRSPTVTYVNPVLTEIPEPSAFGLAGAGVLVGLVGCRRRRRR